MKFCDSIAALAYRRLAPALYASVLAGGLLAPCAVRADDAKADPSVANTLKKRIFKTGDVNHYKLSMKSQVAGADNSVTITFKETTKDAKADGQFTLLDEFESAMANIMGADQDISSFLPTITVVRDKDGKLSNKTEGGIEQAAAQISPVMQQIATIQEAFLPKTPVKVGDKWKVTVTAPGPDGAGAKHDGEATLLGTEVIGGIKSVKLKVSSDVDANDAKVHNESLLNLDPETGKLLKISAKVDGTSGGMKITQELEMSLVPAEKKADAPDKK